jgi:hypothetical protein
VEDFDESLQAMKRYLGINQIPIPRDNVNPEKKAEFYAVDPRIRREIERFNKKDLDLYERCLSFCRDKFASAIRSVAYCLPLATCAL